MFFINAYVLIVDLVGNDIIKGLLAFVVSLVMRLTKATSCKHSKLWAVHEFIMTTFLEFRSDVVILSTKICVSRKSWAKDYNGMIIWEILQVQSRVGIGKHRVLLHKPAQA